MESNPKPVQPKETTEQKNQENNKNLPKPNEANKTKDPKTKTTTEPEDPRLTMKPKPEHCESQINKNSFFVITTKDRTTLDMRDAPFPKQLPYEKLITKFSKNFLEGYLIKDNAGIFSTDKEVVQKQSGLIKDVITQLVKNWAKGGGSMSLSLPVRIFEPRTMLERITDWWAFAPIILKEAAQLTDKLEVFKKVICFALSGLFRSTQQLKPLNPMLGETYQAHWEDGTKIYLEHTCHIPPVSHFLIEDPNHLYRLSGYFDMALDGFLKSMMSNSMGLVPKGKVTVKFFKTGQTIDFQLPKVTIGGLLFGERYVIFTGFMKFEDRKNNLKGAICFNKSRKELKSKRVHDIYGRIFDYNYKKNNDEPIYGQKYYESSVPTHPFPLHRQGIISEITGSWLEEVIFDNKPFYSIRNTQAPQIYPDDIVLPSDSRYREDKAWMQYAWDCPEVGPLYMEYCQGWKWALEAQQRLERGIRNEGNEKRLGITHPNDPKKQASKPTNASHTTQNPSQGGNNSAHKTG